MKRIGILSLYYKTYNYGAQLQAFALQKVIEQLGYSCEQISFKWYCQQTEENYYYSSIDKVAFEEFSFNIPHSSCVYTPDNLEKCVNEYDGFVCGSDQIWGVNDSMPKYVLPLMTLSFVPDNKNKISYAGSMGGSVVAEHKRSVLSKGLGRLDAVSVREKSAIPFLSELSGKEVLAVLDPVMLLTSDEWESLSRDAECDDRYILLYYVGSNTGIIDKSEEFAKKHKLKLINLSYLNGRKAGPKEFVKYIRDAEYVITDSFHATVFSILFHKQFITFGVDLFASEYSRNTRTVDLLKEFNLLDRFIPDAYEADTDLLCKPIDYIAVESKLVELRNLSKTFLADNLSVDKNKRKNSIVLERLCTGCGVCKEACPSECITMVKDNLGFEYPDINSAACISCGKCKEVCPVNKPPGMGRPIEAYSVCSSEADIRNCSSSGGVFYEIAYAFISSGGVVFACRYNKNNMVEHALCDSIDRLPDFCRSKYVQSNFAKVVKEIKSYLENNIRVLVVGTPC